jgi:hypothetical protein
LRIYFRTARYALSRQDLPVALPPTLTAVAAADDQIDVSWVLPEATNAETIELERATVSGGPWTLIDTITTSGEISGTYNDTGRTAGTDYYYQARSYVSTALQPYSGYCAEETATTTTASTPGQPTNVVETETARTATTITYTVSWDAVSGATSYDVWVEASTDGGYSNGSAGAPMTNTASTSVTGIVVTRSAGHDETVFVVASRNASGQGANKRLAVTIDGNLRAPVLNTVTPSGTDVAIRYTEDANADAATEYQIEMDDGGGFAVISTEAPAAAQPQHTEQGLASGDYTFRVRAYDEPNDVYSEYSAEKVATVGGAPPTGYDKGADFSAMSSTADMAGSGFSIQAPLRIAIDPGVGLKYTYIAEPLTCQNAASPTTTTNAPAGAHELWIETTAIFSDNYTTRNTNCSANADYKFLEAWPKPQLSSGSLRCQIKLGVGGNKIACNHTNWTTPNNAPQNVIQVTAPINADALFDGLPHTYRMHWKLFTENGTNKGISQLMIDGVVTHSYKDLANPAWDTSHPFGRINLGQNRNLGAMEEMYLWWRNFYIWTSSDPGWFTGVAITDYAP